MKRTLFTINLVILYLLFLSCVAYGHAVILWAYVENDRVYVEAFTQDGTKIKSAQIVVVDKAGKKLLEGKTDIEGKFNFDPPVRDEMTIVMLIDDAHKTAFKLTAEDFKAQ